MAGAATVMTVAAAGATVASAAQAAASYIAHCMLQTHLDLWEIWFE